MYDFTYAKPGSIADAVKLLGETDAKALAGGQTFIPVLKQRLNKPSAVIDLAKLGLDYIRAEGNTIIVGAMTRHATVAASPEIKKSIAGLAYQASMIGDTQVRHRGTMGGSVANNDPSACYPIGGAGARRLPSRRIAASIAADDYFHGHVHDRPGVRTS